MKWFCLFVLILPALCFAQPDTLWTRTYGGSGDEYTSGIVALPGGDFVVSASTNSYGLGGMDFYLLRITPTGDTVWTQTFGRGPDDDWCNGITRTASGDIVASGYGYSTTFQHQVVRDVTFNDAGVLSGWADQSTLTSDAFGFGVCSNTNGRTADAGYWTSGNGQGQILLYQYFNGEPGQHPLYVAHGYYADAHSVQPTTDGGYILAGSTRATADANSNFLLVRTTSTLDTIWTATYGGTGEDIVNCVIQTRDGGFAFTGPTDSYGAGGGDVVLFKTDANGQLQWMHTYGGDDEEHGHVIIQTQDGGYFIAGHTTSFGTGGDVYCVKTDSMGNLQWTRYWGGDGLDVAQSAVELPDGGFLVAAQTTSFGAGNSDIWVLRIAPPLAANEPPAQLPNGFALMQNYPNPFNASTRISYELPRDGHVALTVFDLLGNARASLFNGSQTAGHHELDVSSSALPSGVYFYRLDAAGWSNTRKMIVLK